MIERERDLHVVEPGAKPPWAFRSNAQLTRTINEKLAIIEGMAELLLEANGTLDEKVARAALESIGRHAAELKGFLKQS